MGRVGGSWRGIVWGAAPLGALAAGGIAVAGGIPTAAPHCRTPAVRRRPRTRSASPEEHRAHAVGPAEWRSATDPPPSTRFHEHGRGNRASGRPSAGAGEHVACVRLSDGSGRRLGGARPAPHPGRRDRGAARPNAGAPLGHRGVGGRPGLARGGRYRRGSGPDPLAARGPARRGRAAHGGLHPSRSGAGWPRHRAVGGCARTVALRDGQRRRVASPARPVGRGAASG